MGCASSKASSAAVPPHNTDAQKRAVAENETERSQPKEQREEKSITRTPVQTLQDVEPFIDQRTSAVSNKGQKGQANGKHLVPCTSEERDLQDIDRILSDPEMSLDLSNVKEGNRASPRGPQQGTQQQNHQQQHTQHQQQQQQQPLQLKEMDPDDPWSALQSQYRPQQLARISPLYEGSPKQALQQGSSSMKGGPAPLPPLKGYSNLGRGLGVNVPLPPLQPAKWEGEDGEVMMIEDNGGGSIPKGRSKNGSNPNSNRSVNSHYSSARSQLSSHTNQKQQAPSGTRKTGGWGNGNLAQPGTLMLDDDEGTVDELEVYVETPDMGDEQSAEAQGQNRADAQAKGLSPSQLKMDEDLGMEDLEEIDELFAQEQQITNNQGNSLASKYAKFEALAADED
mmetsp:Transcript_19807/g.55251  ORF Transcript_19807/g.55251 Transcript_19807/m.55251 type:complete len:396 (+) Transcript_19807:161-1348(+)